MRKAEIRVNDRKAGELWQDDMGYHFRCDAALKGCVRPCSFGMV